MYKEIISAKKGKSKVICDNCKQERRFRNVVKIDGMSLCGVCRNKLLSTRLQLSAALKLNPTNLIPFEKAISKIYEVKGTISKDGQISANIHVPSILIGYKVKFIVIDKNKKRKKENDNN